ncbi:MAG TPA: hypothetical protein VJX67_03265 [Blastocatellia bacterium]|nr:hypothetical protein [Blastocatellia bacterium]
MKMLQNYSKKITVLACSLVLISLGTGLAQANDDSYSFKVHNNSKSTITAILVSEDGETYGKFDIGDGIPAGATVKLVWDKSTNGESCVQHFKAVFDDDTESTPTKFNFCEENLVIEFGK